MRHSFRFSGTGGQGLITAGIILAEAALLDDKLAVQSQSYGPEARGGSSKAEAIISDEAIYFSRVIDPDYLLVMSQEAANKYTADCDEHTTVITDTLFVNEVPGTYGKRVDLPITDLNYEPVIETMRCELPECGSRKMYIYDGKTPRKERD